MQIEVLNQRYEIIKDKMSEYKVKKELGNFLGIIGTRSKNYPFHKAVVDHNQQKIIITGKGKVSDKVNRESWQKGKEEEG